MFPRGSAKKKASHKVPTAVTDCLQIGDALPGNSKTVKVNIGGSSTLEICRIKIIGLELVKLDEEGSGLACWIRNFGRTVANLKPKGWSHLDMSWT